VKYPIFSLLGIVLVGSGCFNPHIKDGGFSCAGSLVGSCPNGYFCVNGSCVANPNAAPPGGGVGGNGVADMSIAMSADMAGAPMATKDMSRSGAVVDMAQPTASVDMANPPPPPPPDMAKGGTMCAHSPCTTGTALNATCSDCVNQFCNDGFFGDPYCCSVKWNSTCVSEYASYGCDTCP
jgi:hypothetical protein